MSDLSNLKVGDAVTIFDGGNLSGLPGMIRSEVVEVTKGGNFKLKGSESLWNQRGRIRGSDSWSHTWAEPFDQKTWDDLKTRHQERRDRIKLVNTDFKNLPIETVYKLLDVLAQEAQKEEK